MKLIVLSALFACALAAPQERFVLPRLPLGVLLQGNVGVQEDGKIVGGVATTPGELPFQISLQRCGALTCSQSCGGSVLGPKTILNAAHCVRGAAVNQFRVVAGEYDLNVVSGNEQNRNVVSYTMHENYGPITSYNDISLIFLDQPLTFNEWVAPVNLPPAGFDPPAGTITTVSGWGTTSSGGSISNRLLKVDVPIVSIADCKAAYGNLNVDANSMICAGNLANGGIDSCQGDSGGPLFTGTGTNAVQHGIVSWGQGCALPGYPGVYTRVASFIDWIATNDKP